MITDWVKNLMSSVVLTLILFGVVNTPESIPGTVDKLDLQYLAGVIQKENGDGTLMCRLLTGSVVLNRLYSKDWDGNTIEEVVMAKDGGYLQYAIPTRDNFKTVKTTELNRAIAKYLLIYGPICPNNVVYQGKNKNAGSGLYTKEPTPNESIKWEYFCFE